MENASNRYIHLIQFLSVVCGCGIAVLLGTAGNGPIMAHLQQVQEHDEVLGLRSKIMCQKIHCGIKPGSSVGFAAFGQAAESARDLKGSTHLFEHGAAKKLQRYIANHTPKDSKSTFAPKILDIGVI